MVEEFVQTGGLRWGVWNATAPFAELRASRESLCIKVGFWRIWQRVFEFMPNDIRTISKFNGLFSVGIFISHSRSDYSTPLIFWTFDYDSLREALVRLGYPIDKSTKSYLDLFRLRGNLPN